MAGPWENYQDTSAGQSEGPWAKYAAMMPAAPEAPAPAAPSVPARPERRITTKLGAALDGPGPNLPATPSIDELGQSWQQAGRNVDDAVRSVANGATFGWADEAAAAANTATGLGPGSTYAENVAAERSRDAQINPNVKLAGDLVGGAMTGSALAKNGITLLNTAKPTYGSMIARGAGEGAAYGAAYGSGQGEGVRGKLEGAAYGALLGAPTGAAMGAVGARMAQQPQAEAPTVNELRKQAQTAYKTAEDAGLVVSQPSFSKTVDEIADAAKSAGIDRTIHPRATAALGRLEEAKGADQSLQQIDILRRVMKSASASTDADERRIARMMVDKFDDYMGGLTQKDVAFGDAEKAVTALNDARDLWGRMRKGEVIDTLVERARNRASQFSGSGYENAIRTEFRALANNDRRMRVFTADEKDAIRRVANGGKLENALRMLGKFAPTGVVSSVLSGGAGAALGGGVGAIALPAAGMAARQGATALTNRNVNAASQLMRSGMMPIGPRQLTSPELTMLRTGMIGGNQLSLMPFRPQPSLINTGQ